MFASLRCLSAALALGLLSAAALAQTAPPLVVKNGWVRATAPGQPATGGFMSLTARENLSLVGVRTPAAGIAEVHEMKMEGDVMRMRALPSLALPAGKTVELKPGSYHLMLQDLKQPLATGGNVTLTLVLKNAQGVESQQTLQLPVATSAPGSAAAPGGHGAHGGMDHGAHKH